MLTKMKLVSDSGVSKPIARNCACVQSRTRLFSPFSHCMCALSPSAAMPATACSSLMLPRPHALPTFRIVSGWPIA